jgi:hypothetical protein
MVKNRSANNIAALAKKFVGIVQAKLHLEGENVVCEAGGIRWETWKRKSAEQ